MAVSRLGHISILTRKPDEVISFYRDFFGFELTFKNEIEVMGMVIFHLKKGDDFIEVVQPLSENQNTDGIKHMAFLSDDIESDFEEFKEKKANMIFPDIQRFEKQAFFFIKSPSGEMVEIIQYF